MQSSICIFHGHENVARSGPGDLINSRATKAARRVRVFVQVSTNRGFGAARLAPAKRRVCVCVCLNARPNVRRGNTPSD